MTHPGSRVLFLLAGFAICFVVHTKDDSSGQSDILIAVLSPANVFHETKAELLKENVESQYKENQGMLKPLVLNLQEQKFLGAWTILPIVSKLVDECPSCKAVIFCNENVVVNLEVLSKEFKKLNFAQDIFGGRALQDSSPTIVHHYNFKNDLSFKYPDFNSGFFLSMALLKKLAERFDRSNAEIDWSNAKIDFSIDAYYELSQYIYDDGKGVNLTSYNFVCGVRENLQNCALLSGMQNPSCNEFKTRNEDVLVAVKTCKKFHDSRLPVLIETWGRTVENIIYFSDERNESIPTHSIGVPNTEQGHCKKFFLILEKCNNIINSHGYKWLFVVDDDTLVSFKRLLNLLSCYNPEDLVYLGERYGYGVVSGHGFDYVTLGGGMAFSRKGLEKVIKSESCRCSKDDAPDDMTLGMCLFNLGLPLTHSPLFHQARPSDYAEAYLESQLPISFHRHWENDPYEVYKKWLEVDIVSVDEPGEPRSDL